MRKLILILAILLGSAGCYAQTKTITRHGTGISDSSAGGSTGSSSSENEEKRDLRGHKWVDLGLPGGVLWAACNIGALRPEDPGDYFGWGETRTKDEYHSANSMTWDRQIGEISRDRKYDAARANWGGSWRLPTRTEMEELINNCSWTWTRTEGVAGYTVTGPNGNSIFMPASGYRYGSSLLYEGTDGDYWTATPNEQIPIDACRLVFAESGHDVGWIGREFAFPIRAVSD